MEIKIANEVLRVGRFAELAAANNELFRKQVTESALSRPRERSSMKLAYHRSQVASHAPLGSEESRMSQTQLVAA